MPAGEYEEVATLKALKHQEMLNIQILLCAINLKDMKKNYILPQ